MHLPALRFSFLRRLAAAEATGAALRSLLLSSVLVLPRELGEAEREDLCDLVVLFAERPVHASARPVELPAGHVCLITEPVTEDPAPVEDSIIVAVRAVPGQRRLDTSVPLRRLRDALLEAIARDADPRVQEIATWAEQVADSPSTALRFASAAHAAYLDRPLAPEATLVAEGLAEVIAWLMRGVDPRVVEWVLARALPAKSPSLLVSTEAAILGEAAALQRAHAVGLVEHLPDGQDDTLDLRRPLAVLRQLDDVSAAVTLPAILTRLRLRIAVSAYGVIDRHLRERPRPLRLEAPVRKHDFVGRDDVLARLMALLEPAHDVRTAVLYGMSGLGKSGAAAALAERVADRLEPVWLTFAGGPEAAWRRVADALGVSPELMADERRTGAKPAWLAVLHRQLAERDALLVVDDAQNVDEAELASWLPRGLGTCSVLVLSTRAERVLQRENDAISVQLRPLSKEESRALLVRKVPSLEGSVVRGAADRLLARLDGHPAAISFVARLLEKRRLEDVTALLEDAKGRNDPKSSMEGVVAAMAIRSLADHAIEELDADEKALAEALAVAAPAGSPRELIAEMTGMPEIGAILQRLADRAVVELRPRSVHLYGLVQLSIEDRLDAGHREELSRAHAEAARKVMRRAHEQRDEETRDEVFADATIALERLMRKCKGGDRSVSDTTRDLAIELMAYPRGPRAETLAKVIAALEALLVVRTRATDPSGFAELHNHLGAALAALPAGDRTENLRRAIDAYETALSVSALHEHPRDWARVQNNLGNALVRLPVNRAENVRRAIDAYRAALSVLTKEAAPESWARTQSDLGSAYYHLEEGSPSENLRRAVEAFEAALCVYSRETHPAEWAMVHHHLGHALAHFPGGDREENRRRAIDSYRMALAVYAAEPYPVEWARLKVDLGAALAGPGEASSAESVREAIGSFEDALTVYTRESYPAEWAYAQHSLGVALCALPEGSRRQNLHAAIDAFRAALTVRTRDAAPEEHAMTQAALDGALAALGALGPPSEPPPNPAALQARAR